METTYRRGIIITFVVTFILLVAMIVVWKLKFYDDVNAQITKTQGELDTATTQGKKLPAALKEKAIAEEQLKLANSELVYFRSRFRSLNFRGIDPNDPALRNVTWQGYMNEYFSGYGLAMRQQLVQAANDSGVNLSTTIKVDAPPQMPENVTVPPNGFLKPVSGGTITVEVTGSFADIMRFLERINRAPILMTVGAIKVEGNSPSLKATFTITPYLVATGDVKLPAAAAAAAPATDPSGVQPTPAP